MLVLLAKNLPFDVVNINLSRKPEWFVENTWGTVSVVRYKNNYIMESLVNCDFIDQLHPNTSLHPVDPTEKAKGRLLVELYGKIRSSYYPCLRVNKETKEETVKERQRLFQEIKKTLEAMEGELVERKTTFFSGQQVGMADLMVWPWMERLPVLNVMFPGEGLVIPGELKSLKNWITAMWAVPAVAVYGIKPEDHVKFYAGYASGNPPYDMLMSS